MARLIRLPFADLVIEGDLASEELVLGSQALDELVVEGSLASEELLILSGYRVTVIAQTFLISRNTGYYLKSRNTGETLISRNLP